MFDLDTRNVECRRLLSVNKQSSSALVPILLQLWIKLDNTAHHVSLARIWLCRSGSRRVWKLYSIYLFTVTLEETNSSMHPWYEILYIIPVIFHHTVLILILAIKLPRWIQLAVVLDIILHLSLSWDMKATDAARL